MPQETSTVSLAEAERRHRDTAWMASEMERLAALVPASGQAAGDPLVWAVEYVERLDGDVLNLERGSAFLLAALVAAERRRDDAAVLHLVDGLAPLATRLPQSADAERILMMGIAASRRAGDRERWATLVNRLGGVLFSRGWYHKGRHLWHTSLDIAERSRRGSGIWRPLASFAQIVDILCGDAAGRAFAQTKLAAHTGDAPGSLAVMLLVRALIAHHAGQLDRARDALEEGLRALASASSMPAHDIHLVTLVIEAELARVTDDYGRARAYAESAQALAHAFSDPYTEAALIIDQGRTAQAHGQLDDMATNYQRLRAVIPRLSAEHVPETARSWASLLGLQSSGPHTMMSTPLSAREAELLRLVAQGHPNREIAERLVITNGTVKKHLEHIYAKLDAPNRTTAVARARTLGLLT